MSLRRKGPYLCEVSTAEGDGWAESREDTLPEARAWCREMVASHGPGVFATAHDRQGRTVIECRLMNGKPKLTERHQ